MKNTILHCGLKAVFVMLLISPILTFAQTTNPPPAPVPVSTPPVISSINEAIKRNQEFYRMKNARENQRLLDELRVRERKMKAARTAINELYRKPTANELRTVKIDQDLLEKYGSFLQQEDTGIVKLLNNSDCSENSKVIVATTNCLGYRMPGAASSFSFRINNYRINHLADLTLSGKFFKSAGVWAHGILVNFGDFPLEEIGSQTKELKYLNEINPDLEYENAKSFSFKLAKGIENGKLSYGNSTPVLENSTYLLRSIAYRGTVKKSVEGVVYNELDFDKRRDILVVFRVVRSHSDGGITILWKKISSKESPKITNKDIETDSKLKKSEFVGKISK